MNWYSGKLTVYNRQNEAVVHSIKNLSLEEAQEILDRQFPREIFYAVYAPDTVFMEAR